MSFVPLDSLFIAAVVHPDATATTATAHTAEAARTILRERISKMRVVGEIEVYEYRIHKPR